MRAVILEADARLPHLIARSTRSLRAAGFDEIHVCHSSDPESYLRLDTAGPGGLLALRAGAWLRHPRTFHPPPGHARGRPVVAVGHFSGPKVPEVWQELFSTYGGDFSHAPALPPVLCEWYDEVAIRAGWPQRRLGFPGLESTMHRYQNARVVHWQPLDAGADEGLRCLQIVTSLQHGGAEKIAWELARDLPHQGVATRLVALGKPLRRTLPDLPGTVDLSRFDRAERVRRLDLLAQHFGADVLHGHLIDAEDIRLFSALGLPLATTIHNTRAAWPAGLETLKMGEVGLLIACAQEVEKELRELALPIPLRTVWNGIDLAAFSPSADQRASSGTSNSLTLVCVANPRPQKRLHLLPGILAATKRALTLHGIMRPLRLILAGEASPRSPAALECREQVEAEALRHGVAESITWTEGKAEVAEVLAAADIAVSCSAYEGLSLAHMEAMAAGLPLISTDAGGTRELAPKNPALILLPLDASPEVFAQAIVNTVLTPPATGREAMARDFSASRMAGRVIWLLAQLARSQPKARHPKGLLFITNNLATGGAQSSLRRLVTALHEAGTRVQVALLQEYPEHPTPGREALLTAGVPVIVPPPAGMIDAADAVTYILQETAPTPPATVVFWNAIPVYKVLLADAFWDARVFDVSPGEMFFASLDRYFRDPRPALPYRCGREYGHLLAAVIVKYSQEAPQAREALGVPAVVIPNGVALPHFSVQQRDSPSPSPLIFGTAVRISPQKRLEDLLEAFRLALPRLPFCELHFAGAAEHDTAEYAQALQQASHDLPVRWLGDIRDVSSFHRTLDVFVMISEPAGCPNASMEALAAGLPVIATDFGGASEQVIHGQTGILVPNRQPQALAEALIQLALDPAERVRLGRAGRQHIEGSFTLHRMIARYRDVLE